MAEYLFTVEDFLNEEGAPHRCPHCADKYRGELAHDQLGFLFVPNPALNKVSRRDGRYICHACGLAETLADYMGIPDNMARTVVENNRQEAMRLPPGNFVGYPPMPTGGLDVYLDLQEIWSLLAGEEKYVGLNPAQTSSEFGQLGTE